MINSFAILADSPFAPIADLNYSPESSQFHPKIVSFKKEIKIRTSVTWKSESTLRFQSNFGEQQYFDYFTKNCVFQNWN